MQTNGVSGVSKDYTTQAQPPKNKNAAEKTAQNTETKNTTPASTFERSRHTVDMPEIFRIIRESQDQLRMFEDLLRKAFGTQAQQFTLAWGDMVSQGNLREQFENITISQEAIEQARELVSEDGYFGVKQTSERLLSFARAFAGSDPARIELMRGAFLKGFAAAERIWGGQLPEISQKTFDAVIRGFDEMLEAAKPAKAE
jgi:hypothetical protein